MQDQRSTLMDLIVWVMQTNGISPDDVRGRWDPKTRKGYWVAVFGSTHVRVDDAESEMEALHIAFPDVGIHLLKTHGSAEFRR